MGSAGEFPDIRTYVRSGCRVCDLPPEMVRYMHENAHEVGNNWSAWVRWLKDQEIEMMGDRIRRHFVLGHDAP